MSNAKSERSREAGYTVTSILLVFTSGGEECLEVYLCEAKFRGMCVLSQAAESAGNVSDLSPLLNDLSFPELPFRAMASSFGPDLGSKLSIEDHDRLIRAAFEGVSCVLKMNG